MTRQHNGLRLTKWYADAAWPGGGEILYRARLDGTRIGLGAHITQQGRAVRPVHWQQAEPRFNADGLVFPAAWGAPERCWKGADAAESIVLHEDADVRVLWEVVVKNGAVLGPGVPQGARGYAERLELSGWPWRLGLKRLLWGRFCGNRHSLVWIAWEGRLNRCWCRLNGNPLHGLRVTLPGLVEAEGARLEMLCPNDMVDEPIRNAVWRVNLPGQAGRFMAGRERKWHAQARLFLDGGETDNGHVVHEEVSWS